jgi:TPR repeat protein
MRASGRDAGKLLARAKRGDPDAQYRLAALLASSGRRGRKAEALRWLREASDAGHHGAEYALATWYLHGVALRKNFRLAVSLLKEAARAGHAY